MAEFYKFEIGNWNEGTANLTLEQEAAYLRIVNAIRLTDQPITLNKFALCGLWRCNERRAKRLLQELVDAGKVRIEDGKIINDKAVNDASTLRRWRADRESDGRRGGIESAKSRANALKSNEPAQGYASSQVQAEKRREEDTLEPNGSNGADAPIDPAKVMFDAGRKMLTDAGKSRDQAGKILGKWRNDHGTEAVIAALGRAQREGAIDPVAFVEGVLKFTARQRQRSGPMHGEERTTTDGRRQVYHQFNGWETVHV